MSLDHDRFLRLVRGHDRSPPAAAARLGLSAAAAPYRAAVALRNRAFDLGLRRPMPLGRPTVSIGNLTTGGTGKTPMVIDTVRRLRATGERPAVLLRGYGDDETRELATALADTDPPTPVEANPSRVAQAAALLERCPDVSAFVLDDGFQHRQAHRDLDLVLIDATDPFGGGRLLPRGLLREPTCSLRRAHGVIVTRSDQVDAETLARLDAEIERLTDRPPLAHVAATWRVLRVDEAADEQPTQTLRERRVLGACGIGNPGAFERQLRQAAGEVVGMETRNDHHPWTAEALREVLDRAAAAGGEAVVTTEKDWVKWRPLLGRMPDSQTLPIYRPILMMRFLDGEAAFATLLQEATRRSSLGR